MTATPVTVIGGFLGAGKTTLLNRILRTGGRRYAVLVNDFGSVNVDAALIESEDGLTRELDNGCICCSMSGGVGPALDAAMQAGPEAVIIEGSGVGDPWRIAELALIDARFSLELVITLVDALNFPRQLRDEMLSDTLERQLGHADLIVLNKTDLAAPAEIAAAEAAARRIRPDARLVLTVESCLPGDLLGDLAPALAARPTPAGDRNAHDVHDHDGHDHDVPNHEDQFARWLTPVARPLDRPAFERALAGMPVSLLRLKGWVRFVGAEGAHLVQYTAGRYRVSPADDPTAEPVLVGIGLPDPLVEPALAALAAP